MARISTGANESCTSSAKCCGAARRPAAVAEGMILGECVNLTRRLVNEPPSAMTPARFAEEASGLAATFGLEIDVWDEHRLQQERCGALLAVARGSVHPPRLVTIKYSGFRRGRRAHGAGRKGCHV